LISQALIIPCYDSSHSHEDTGFFNQGYLSVLKRLKDCLYELDKDTFLMIENCGDIYGSYVWGSLTWNGEKLTKVYVLSYLKAGSPLPL
jgi:hypothetical protein